MGGISMVCLKTRMTNTTLVQSKRRFRTRLRIELLEDRCVPSTITPTTFADGGLGSGSLRDAVLQFNADAGTEDDIIQLEAGTYTLTIKNTSYHTSGGLDGDLYLTQTSHRWIIQGAGPSTIIDASQLQDRVFQIVNPGTQVVFQDLVIQGGLAQDNGTPGAKPGTTDGLGGGIFNNSGNLTLDNVVLENNVARGGDGADPGGTGYNSSGGGIYSTQGSLSISSSAMTGNQAIGGTGGDGPFGYQGGTGGRGQGGSVYAAGSMLSLSDSTIANNRAYGGRGGRGANPGPGGDGAGGGIYATGALINITNTKLSGSNGEGGGGGTFTGTCGSGNCPYGIAGSGQGGGVYASGGLLTLTNATILGNSVYGELVEGGGVYVSGTLTVSWSTIASNSLSGSVGHGGGACVKGTLTVDNSAFFNNTIFSGPSQGGGLYVSGTSTVSDSAISSNTLLMNCCSSDAKQGGGGYVSGTLTVSNSTIVSNTIFGTIGYSIGGASQGGGLYISGQLTLSNSTIAANTARGGDTYGSGSGGAGHGGGLYLSGTSGILIVSDSTITANVVRGGDSTSVGSGGAAQGGGVLLAAGATAHVSFCTIATNQATGGSRGPYGGNDGPATGGGVNNQGHLQTYDSLLAGNTVDGPGTNTGPDLVGDLGSLGHNLIGDSTGGSGYDPTDLLDVDPLLGPPQNNGGPTDTMALLPGSPAIDAGDNTDAPEWDQRGPGYPRIVNGIIDIGAFEYQGDGSGPAILAVPPSLVPLGMGQSAVLSSAVSATRTPIPSEADPGMTSPGSDAEHSSVQETLISFQENDGWRVDTWWDHVEIGDPGPLLVSQPWKGGGQ
jgi:hypothetical protein